MPAYLFSAKAHIQFQIEAPSEEAARRIAAEVVADGPSLGDIDLSDGKGGWLGGAAAVDAEPGLTLEEVES